MIIKGQLIDNRYKIIKSIGEGGMANVYLAFDTILEREVAVKILRGDLAEDEKFVRRFQREANSASSLKHPNIVEVYDVGEDDGKYFIVMEYINGKTLKSLIKKRGILTLEEVIDIMLQLTSAVSCAHDSYIIHRDIKPQNVMILEDGRVKITDFGIAMALNNNELTQTNSVMGSVHYLPPEQANGSGSTIKSDIYSLGILMFELLTGKLPFKGENAVEIAIKQMREPIPSVKSISPDIPQSVENVVLKACAKNPKNRYDTAREMFEDIKTCMDPVRSDEKRIVYKYPENDLDETKVMPNLSRLNNHKEDVEETEEEVKENKKFNKIMIILGIVAGVLVIGIIIAIIAGKLKGKYISIPDGLVGEKKADVIEILEGDFKIKEKKEYSDKYKKNVVTKVDPKEKSKVKKGSIVTITVSKGKKQITVEDYTGMNIDTVKKKLEAAGVSVVVTAKKVDKSGNYKENTVIEQSVKSGEKLSKGDAIELTYATLITVYPDFTNGKYSVTDVNTFCDENKIKCSFEEKESTSKDPGTILEQSKKEGSEVSSGDTLKITTAKAKSLTVSFSLDGGTGNISAQTVEYNKTASEPRSNPTKNNCEFEYWTLNGNRFYFDTKITSDTTLVAKWSCKSEPIQAGTNNTDDKDKDKETNSAG